MRRHRREPDRRVDDRSVLRRVGAGDRAVSASLTQRMMPLSPTFDSPGPTDVATVRPDVRAPVVRKFAPPVPVPMGRRPAKNAWKGHGPSSVPWTGSCPCSRRRRSLRADPWGVVDRRRAPDRVRVEPEVPQRPDVLVHGARDHGDARRAVDRIRLGRVVLTDDPPEQQPVLAVRRCQLHARGVIRREQHGAGREGAAVRAGKSSSASSAVRPPAPTSWFSTRTAVAESSSSAYASARPGSTPPSGVPSC